MKSFKEFMSENFFKNIIPFYEYPGRKSYNPFHNKPGNPDGEVTNPPESNPKIKPSAHPGGGGGRGRPGGVQYGNPAGEVIDVTSPFGR